MVDHARYDKASLHALHFCSLKDSSYRCSIWIDTNHVVVSLEAGSESGAGSSRVCDEIVGRVGANIAYGELVDEHRINERLLGGPSASRQGLICSCNRYGCWGQAIGYYVDEVPRRDGTKGDWEGSKRDQRLTHVDEKVVESADWRVPVHARPWVFLYAPSVLFRPASTAVLSIATRPTPQD